MTYSRINYTTFLYVSLCLVSSSIEPIIVKMGYRGLVTPFQLIIIKFLVGGIVILPLIKKYPWCGIKGLQKIAWTGFLLMATGALVLVALKFLSAIIVITIITTTPAFVAIVNQMLGRDILGKKFWIGFGLCFIGILLSLEIHKTGAPSVSFIGLLSVFGSVILSTIYRTRLDAVTKEFPPMMVSTYMFIIDAIIALIFLPCIWPVSGKAWAIGVVIGIAAAIANITFLVAIHLMGSTRMSILGVLQRPIVIVAAALILKESLTIIQMIGILLVLAGVQMAKVTKRVSIQGTGDRK